MGSNVATRRRVVTGAVGLLVAAAAQGGPARPPARPGRVLSEQASLAPDGRSISFDIATRCDRKWTVVEATVSGTQAQAWGEGSFAPICNRLTTVVGVTVPALDGAFQTGSAEVRAVLVVQQS